MEALAELVGHIYNACGIPGGSSVVRLTITPPSSRDINDVIVGVKSIGIMGAGYSHIQYRECLMSRKTFVDEVIAHTVSLLEEQKDRGVKMVPF